MHRLPGILLDAHFTLRVTAIIRDAREGPEAIFGCRGRQPPLGGSDLSCQRSSGKFCTGFTQIFFPAAIRTVIGGFRDRAFSDV